MRHSVFWKIILAVGILSMIAQGALFVVLYQLTYNYSVNDATENIKNAASSAALVLELYDPNDLDDIKQASDYLCKMCNSLGVTYLYSIRPDLEKNDEIYLVTGWGKNASKEYVENRYPGYVAEGKLREEQIRAYNGEKEVMLHVTNQYDDTLICYTPVVRHYSDETGTYIEKTESVVCAEVSLNLIMDNFKRRFGTTAIFVVIVSALIMITTGLILYFRVSKPLQLISGRMKNFISKKDEFFEKLPVKGKDEIAQMSDSFNTMAEEIDTFIMRMSEMNRQKAELHIARKIQRGLLEDPSFSNGNVSIEALMQPAKDVGGDLYDYRVLENGDIFVTIADVSGKGITASLFMARAVTLLSQFARLGYSPAKMLYEYNNSLAGRNPNMMFITTFVAVYHPQTGELVYANAGHNYPYIISDTLISLNEKHGAAAGVFKNVKYPEYTVKMKPGDRLFLYTDGVTEARNKEGGFFDEEKLEGVLKAYKNSGADELVKGVKEVLDSFANGAEQADDITMLALEILPEKPEKPETEE